MKTSSYRSWNIVAIMLFLAVLVAAYRILRVEWLSEWPNFAPLTAIAFCGGFLALGWRAAAVLFAALLLSDLWLNQFYGVSLITSGMMLSYLAYGVAFAVGYGVRSCRAGTVATLGAAAGSSLFFYLFTNSMSWLSHPAYAKSWAGWWQAITVGVPGYPPTWMFFRNSLLSDLFFTAVILFVVAWAGRSTRSSTVEQRTA